MLCSSHLQDEIFNKITPIAGKDLLKKKAWLRLQNTEPYSRFTSGASNNKGNPYNPSLLSFCFSVSIVLKFSQPEVLLNPGSTERVWVTIPETQWYDVQKCQKHSYVLVGQQLYSDNMLFVQSIDTLLQFTFLGLKLHDRKGKNLTAKMCNHSSSGALYHRQWQTAWGWEDTNYMHIYI